MDIEAKDHETVRLVCMCDPHLSAHTPTAYKVDYWDVVQDTMKQVAKFAKNKDVDAIVWAGDIFNLKAASRNPLKFMGEVVEMFQSFGSIPHVGIAGNHDLLYGSLEGLKGQPLDLLIKTGIYHLLDTKPLRIFSDQTRPEGGPTLTVKGQSYTHGTADGVKAFTKKDARYLMGVGHFWYGPISGEFFGEHIYGPDFLDNSEVDLYLIGHHHEDQGVHLINEKHYIVHGSISKIGAHKHDLDRRPAASYIEITKEGVNVTIIRPKFPESKDIMDLEKRKQIAEEKEEMDEFINNLGSATMTMDDPKSIIKEMELGTQVRAKVMEYITSAEEEIDS